MTSISSDAIGSDQYDLDENFFEPDLNDPYDEVDHLDALIDGSTIEPDSDGLTVMGEVLASNEETAKPSKAVATRYKPGGLGPLTQNLWTADDYAASGNEGAAADKLADSGVAPLIVAARPYETVTEANLAEATIRYNLPRKNTGQGKRIANAATRGDLLIMPWYTGEDLAVAVRKDKDPIPTTIQYRPSRPDLHPKTGKEMKYEFVAGNKTPIGIHPAFTQEWIDGAPVVLLAEGLLKGDSALTGYLLDHGVKKEDLDWPGGTTQAARERLTEILDTVPVEARVVVLTIGGVDNWKSNREWRDLELKSREVWLGIDGDVSSNPHVYRAANELWDFLANKKKANVSLLAPIVKAGDDTEKVGIDDYLTKHSNWLNLLSLRANHLPANPNEGGLVGGAGTDLVLVDTGSNTIKRHVVREVPDEFGGSTLAEFVTPVLGASIENLSSEAVEGGYEDGDRTVKHTLRVTVTGHAPVIVRGWLDSDLGNIAGILEQAGAVGTQAVWHEVKTPYLRAEIEGAIRRTRAADYKDGLAKGRTGLVCLPEGTEPDLADRDHADIVNPTHLKADRVWVHLRDTGAVPPDTHEAPRARSEVGMGAGLVADVPNWRSPSEVVEDIRTLLTEVMPAYNDKTLRVAHNAKTAWALSGAKGGGALLGHAVAGSGKTEDGKFTLALNGGKGDPVSAVNNSAQYLPSIADSCTNKVTYCGDLKRIEGDEQTWPALSRAATNLARRDYDGPAAARGRNTGADGGFKAGTANQAWPSIILDGELAPWFDASTMAKIFVVSLAATYIKPGQAKAVLARLTDEGLPARLSRSLTEWVCGMAYRWAGGTGSLERIESYWGMLMRKTPETGSEGWNLLTDEQRDAASKWSPRHQEVAASYLLGHSTFVDWMLDVVESGTEGEDFDTLVDLIMDYRAEGARLLFEAQAKHVERTTGGESSNPEGSILGKVGLAMAAGKAHLDGDKEVGPEVARFATLIGKVSPDPAFFDLIPSQVAEVIGSTEATVKAALRNVAEKQSDGYIVKPRINGARPSCYRVPVGAILGDDDQPSVEVQAERLRAKIASLEADLDTLLAVVDTDA